MATAARTTQPTLDELKTAADAAQKAFADAMAEETRKTQAAAWDEIADHLEAVTEAAENHDTTAIRAAVAELSQFVRSTFGTVRRTSSGNGGERATHDGPPIRDLVMAYLNGHPGAHTPGTIGKALGRSPGAVSAAIERPNTGLLATADVTRTSDKPKMYATA